MCLWEITRVFGKNNLVPTVTLGAPPLRISGRPRCRASFASFCVRCVVLTARAAQVLTLFRWRCTWTAIASWGRAAGASMRKCIHVPGMGAGRGRLVTGMHCIWLHVFDFAWPAAMVGSQELPVPRRCWSIWGLVVSLGNNSGLWLEQPGTDCYTGLGNL